MDRVAKLRQPVRQHTTTYAGLVWKIFGPAKICIWGGFCILLYLEYASLEEDGGDSRVRVLVTACDL